MLLKALDWLCGVHQPCPCIEQRKKVDRTMTELSLVAKRQRESTKELNQSIAIVELGNEEITEAINEYKEKDKHHSESQVKK